MPRQDGIGPGSVPDKAIAHDRARLAALGARHRRDASACPHGSAWSLLARSVFWYDLRDFEELTRAATALWTMADYVSMNRISTTMSMGTDVPPSARAHTAIECRLP